MQHLPLRSQVMTEDPDPPLEPTAVFTRPTAATRLRVFSAARRASVALLPRPIDERITLERESAAGAITDPTRHVPTAGSPRSFETHASIASNIATRRSPLVVVASAKTASLSARSVRNRLGGLVS